MGVAKKREYVHQETNVKSLAIRVAGVSKTLSGRQVLSGVFLEMPTGTICGICGHNGSGKSMLLRAIVGLVLVDSGTIEVFGQRVGQDVEFPQDVGAMIDGPGLLLDQSGRRNLELLAQIRRRVGLSRVVEVLGQVGLDPGDRRPAKTYSMGMKQRLGIAQALLEQPRLLILDEPSNALDREGVDEIHDLLRGLGQQGVSILLTSHSKSELRGLCHTVFRMERGVLAPLEDDEQAPFSHGADAP